MPVPDDCLDSRGIRWFYIMSFVGGSEVSLGHPPVPLADLIIVLYSATFKDSSDLPSAPEV